MGGQSSRQPGAAPVSNSTGPAFGCSISAAIIATSRRGEAGAGSERVLTPAPASGQPSSYSRNPRSSRCSFTASPLLARIGRPAAARETPTRPGGPTPDARYASALQRLRGLQPCRLERLALGAERLELRGQLGEADVVGRLLGHRVVQARLALAEAVERAFETRDILARLAQRAAPAGGAGRRAARRSGSRGRRLRRGVRLGEVLLDPAGQVADRARAVERVHVVADAFDEPAV